MKHVLSVSLGSSKRDHKVEVEILGEKFIIERRGTDGDIKKAIEIIKEMDGKVSAFGMGGIDLYLSAGNRRYMIRDAVPIARAAKISPIVDGSGLKNTLERKVINYLVVEKKVDFKGKKVLLVSAMDRFGMAEALAGAGCHLIIGDLIFALGIPVPIRSLKTLDLLAKIVAPFICRLPFKMLYPTGEKQEKVDPRYRRFYDEADIIAGDFHFIRRYMPPDISGKIIITNTVTPADVKMLRERGADLLITTTPELEGRSFGTNVMEGVLVSLSTKPYKELTPADYEELLDKIGFAPRIETLNDAAGLPAGAAV
jgi:hypothetical protein